MISSRNYRGFYRKLCDPQKPFFFRVNCGCKKFPRQIRANKMSTGSQTLNPWSLASVSQSRISQKALFYSPKFIRYSNSPEIWKIPTIRCMRIAAEEAKHQIKGIMHPYQSDSVLPFAKYHGLGNDFIMVDNRSSDEPRITPEQAVKLCDRNFGVGADGVIFVMPGVNGTDYTMRIFNSDGSEPEMCGNGVRCFARYLGELKYNDNLPRSYSFKIHTGAGLIVPEVQLDGKVKVDMGEPILSAIDIPTVIPANNNGAAVKAELVVDGVTWNVTCVSMGNPHCVTFSSEKTEDLHVDDLKLEEIGPKFEHHEMFPARINTEFVQVISRSHLKMRVWERGAGATLACGTGACAVVVAAVLEGRAERTCVVDLPGGPLEIEWREEDNHLYMTGPGIKTFIGEAYL